MIKIVRIVTRMNIGGPSLHVALLTNHLDPVKFSTTLIVGPAEPEEGSRQAWIEKGPAKLFQVSCLRRAIHPWLDLQAFWNIARLLFREQPRVIHTHMAKAGTLGRLAGIAYNRWGPGRKSGEKALLIHTFHGHVLEGYFPPLISRMFVAMERWLSRRTDCLIAVSPTVRNEILAKGIGSKERWRVIPLGIDLSQLRHLPISNGSAPLRCGLVGRLVPIKNPALFLKALRQVALRHPKNFISAEIVGDGPLRAEMEEIARNFGLGEQVAFRGWQEKTEACYRNLDVVCVTSHNEGTPVSLIEAMAAGRVAVSTAVGGVGDLLGRRENQEIPSGSFQVGERGLLVQDGDAKGLAAALEALVQDPTLRKRLAENGRIYVAERYGHARLLQDVSELYDRLGNTGGIE